MNKSESIKEISVALSKLGADLGNVSKNSVNPFFKSKYADLASILDYVKPSLAEHGLSIVQSSRQTRQKVLIIETLLTHESGEWIETEIEVPASQTDKKTQIEKYDAQTVGSAVTYGRRYALSAILNISSEEDNDGNKIPDKKPVEPPVTLPSNYILACDALKKETTLDGIDKVYNRILTREWSDKEKEALNLLYNEVKIKVVENELGADNGTN